MNKRGKLIGCVGSMEGTGVGTIKQQALTRLRNDDFRQADDMRITGFALQYYLNAPGINCPSSFPVDATTRIQKSGASWVAGQWKTDVESDLKNINRLSTRVRDNSASYNPQTNKFNRMALQPAPDESFPELFNRITNPPCTLRGTGWNRWQPLPHNPQLTYETPFDFFIPARDQDKQRYKTHGECIGKPSAYD
jgi:hypothetical protein